MAALPRGLRLLPHAHEPARAGNGLWSELAELCTSESARDASGRPSLTESLRIALLSRFNSKIKSNYFSITLNWLDLPAVTLVFIAVCARLAHVVSLTSGSDVVSSVSTWSLVFGDDGEDLEAWMVLHAPAVLLLWVRQLRILRNCQPTRTEQQHRPMLRSANCVAACVCACVCAVSISYTGPLVLMIIRMFRDMVKWAAVMSIFLLAFWAAFDAIAPSCEETIASNANGRAALFSPPLAVRLLDATITGNNPHPSICMPSEPQRMAGLSFGYVFLLVANVLMLNLLIASTLAVTRTQRSKALRPSCDAALV